MSTIQEKLKQLKEQENQLRLEQLTIDFLSQIKNNVIGYEDREYNEVKDRVVKLIDDFVVAAIKSIETGTELYCGPPKTVTPIKPNDTVFSKEEKTKQKDIPPSTELPTELRQNLDQMDHGSMLSFHMEHRDLLGTEVEVPNKITGDMMKGKVKGLEAPHVLIEIEGHGLIKVPPGVLQ